MLTATFFLAELRHVVHGSVLVIFMITALLLTLVILMQEGKGGGLAGAFGGAGAETFGVKAGTVNRFTAWLAAAFLGLALIHAGMTTWIAEIDRSDAGAPNIEDLRGSAQPPAGGTQDSGDGAVPPGDGSSPGSGDAGSGDAGSGDAGSGDAGAGDGAGDPPKEEGAPDDNPPDEGGGDGETR